MTESWLPKKGNKFNAVQKKAKIPARHNPQACVSNSGYYIAATDAAGNNREFHGRDWRFEKV